MFLDCGNIDRNSASVLRDGAHLLNIDHHHDNTRFGTLNYVVPEASCTAEIVWDLMHGLDVRPTPAVAEALYIGLITDTGRFMYENTGPRAHVMAAELIEAGVDVAGVYRRLYEDMPLGKLALLALALAQHAALRRRRARRSRRSAPRTSTAPTPRRATPRASSTSCARCRARRSRCSCASSRAASARASTKSRCAPPTTTSTCRSSPARRAAAGTAAPPASRPTLELEELIAFLREAIAAQLHPSSDGRAAADARLSGRGVVRGRKSARWTACC